MIAYRPRYNFENRCALVTGGTSGMGRAIAEGLAAGGASVVITGRDESRGGAVVAGMGAQGRRVSFVPGDITDGRFCGELVKRADRTMDGIDIVVNSAGVIHHATVDETSDDQWLETFDVNVNGMFYVCRAAVPVLRDRGGDVDTAMLRGEFDQRGIDAETGLKEARQRRAPLRARDTGRHRHRR